MVGHHGLGLLGVVAPVHGTVVGELSRVGLRNPGVVGGPEDVGWTGGLMGDRGDPGHGGPSREQLHQVGLGEALVQCSLGQSGGHRRYRSHAALMAWK